MNFCIIRAIKLTKFGSISSSAGHTFRQLATPNADPGRTALNRTVGAKSMEDVCAAVRSRLPVKRRKDAVLCIEYLVTASPEWFRNVPVSVQEHYFDGALAWLRKRHGADNVVCANLQLDETSPHLVVYVVPLCPDGRLSAKDFLGSRAKLSSMQSEFWETVGRPAGLARGIEGSRARHTANKRFNAALTANPQLLAPSPPAVSVLDRLTGRANELRHEYEKQMAGHATLLERARATALLSGRARLEHARAIVRMRAELAFLKEARDASNRRAEQEIEHAVRLLEQNRTLESRLSGLDAELEFARQAQQCLRREVVLLRHRLEPDDAVGGADRLAQPDDAPHLR